MELDELARQYGLETLDERKAILNPTTEEQIEQVEYIWYRDFIKATDTGILTAFETLFAEPTKFAINIISLYKEYSTLIKARAYARTKIVTNGE